MKINKGVKPYWHFVSNPLGTARIRIRIFPCRSGSGRAFLSRICADLDPKLCPKGMANFNLIATYCCFSLMVALGAVISCFHILYATTFEIIFPRDPQQLGRRIFILLAMCIVLPNTAEGIVKTWLGWHVDKAVTPLTHSEYRAGLEIHSLVIRANFAFFESERTKVLIALIKVQIALVALFVKSNRVNCSCCSFC